MTPRVREERLFLELFQNILPPQACSRAPLRQQLISTRQLAESGSSDWWPCSTSKGKTLAESSEKSLQAAQEGLLKTPTQKLSVQQHTTKKITPYFSKGNLEQFIPKFRLLTV